MEKLETDKRLLQMKLEQPEQNVNIVRFNNISILIQIFSIIGMYTIIIISYCIK
jgi:hypothetical protein